MEAKEFPDLIDRRVDEFSKEKPSVEEIASFLSLDRVTVPLERPYIWSNTIVSLDGICSIGQGKRGVRLIGLHHIPNSQGYTDFRLLSAGWASSDAIIFSAAGLRTESEQKLLVVHPDLLKWRIDTLKRQSIQPSVVIVTNSGWLDIKHPIWSTDRLKIIATSNDGEKAIHKYLLDDEKELSNNAGNISLWLKKKYNTIIKSFQDTQNKNSIDLAQLCTYLKVVHKFQYLDISAGPTLVNLFLKSKLVDECRYTRSGILVGQRPWDDCEGIEGPDKRPLQYPASIKLINDIQKGAELKHAETQDKSRPMIEKGATVHQSNRKQLLQEVEKEHHLQHPECMKDRSNPIIEEGAKVGKTERPALLNEIRQVKAQDE